MTRRISSVFMVLIITLQTSILFAGQLPLSLERYKSRAHAALATESNSTVTRYLSSCLSAVEYLNGLEVGDPRVSDAFRVIVGKRITAAGDLTPETSGAPGVIAEKEAYDQELQPYVKSEYINLITLQEQLLERKYFKTETAKNANFIEGYVNSRWSFTRADHSDIKNVLRQAHLGVSPWEAIFRLEPTLAFEHGAQAALLGTAGMSYTFFPDINREKTPMQFEEDFWSKWVQKSGIRLGVGVGNLDNHAKLLLGLGTQVNALGLWGLYKPDGGSFMFGLSASDLSKFKKAIAWFQ